MQLSEKRVSELK